MTVYFLGFRGKRLKLTGKHVCALVAFAQRNPGWHSAAKGRPTQQALKRAVKHGVIELNEFGQFRISEGVTQ